MQRPHLTALVALAIAIPATSAAQPGRAVLRVPADFGTIQQAVDAAAPGDMVLVAPGVYCEQVVITAATANLQLRAAPAVGTDRAVLSGACATAGYGFHVRGTSAAPVAGVEISGFVVEGFDTGIVLEYATGSIVRLNEVRDNLYRGSTTPGWARGQGILLLSASGSEIAQNFVHGNGHLGIGLRNGSNDNLVRANRLVDNQAQPQLGGCTLMLWGATNSRNRIVENEVTGATGAGIMIGPQVQTGNFVAQNRVHGHPWEGILVMSGSGFNVIEQNNALGNGLDGWTDLWDANTTNLWVNNLGTCEPGNAGCEI